MEGVQIRIVWCGYSRAPIDIKFSRRDQHRVATKWGYFDIDYIIEAIGYLVVDGSVGVQNCHSLRPQ